jgi:hypothetical protein
MKKKHLIFSSLLLCCLCQTVSAQSGQYPWLKVTQTDPQTNATIDQYYVPIRPYTGSELRAGILVSTVQFDYANVPFDATIADKSMYVGYTNMYGQVGAEMATPDALAALSTELASVDTGTTRRNNVMSLYRGGRYTFRTSIPGIGYEYTKEVEVIDTPSMRVKGSSIITGKDFDINVIFNTGYPYDLSQLTGLEKAQLTLYAISYDKEGNEIGQEIKSTEQALRLHRTDQPLVAAIDSINMNMEKPRLGLYRMTLLSDWKAVDANTSFILSVNDTLRSSAQLDKEKYTAVDKKAHLTVTADYGYPHITAANEGNKPKFSVELVLADSITEDGVKQLTVLDKYEHAITDDSLAVDDLKESITFDIDLPAISALRKSAEHVPLTAIAYIKFNDMVKARYHLPLYISTPTGISHDLTDGKADSRWYNLQGRPIDSQQAKHGIYIKDRKKIIIK